MSAIYIRIVFTDSSTSTANLKLYPSDEKGQPIAGKGFAAESDGLVAITGMEQFPVTVFPYALHLKRINTRVATLLIISADMFSRMQHTDTEPRQAYRTLVYTLSPAGVATPAFETNDVPGKSIEQEFTKPTKLPPVLTDPINTTLPMTDIKPLKPQKPVPTRLRGKVADLAARIIPRNVQVVFFGKTADAAKAEPVSLTQTDSYGNFSTEYPRGTYTAVYAVVSSSPDEKIPVTLQPDGAMPEFMLLIMQELDRFSSQDEHDDCACHSNGTVPRLPDEEDLIGSDSYTQDIGGACVNFTTPNRALEEFKYYKIVRTTDPEVKDSMPLFSPDFMAKQAKLWEEVGNLIEMVYRIAKSKNPLIAFATSKPPFTTAEQTELNSIAKAIIVAPSTQNKLSDFFSPALLKDSGLENGHEFWQAINERRREYELAVNRVSTRREISASTAIDWDDTPTTYQATSVAHGHLLEFRQVWRADGYSMGDLLYSLPLAPGQKKQIVIYDWTRKESASRSESLAMEEQLDNELSRDRDINEIVDSVINESVEGSSHVTGKGHSGGFGIGAGGQASGKSWNAILGISGGYSRTKSDMSSEASQQSSRDVSASSMQQIHDQTKQSASAVRNQRSTVVTTATQGETMNITTEVIANHNHCHAITMQYFEVLRHFALHTELADVQECLFIPLDVSAFDDKKVLRWEHLLRRGVPRGLQRGFDAVRRWTLSGGNTAHDAYAVFPPDVAPGIFGTYADLQMENISLEFRFEMAIARPSEIKPEDGESVSSLLFGNNNTAGIGGGFAGPWHSINAAQLEAAGKALVGFTGGLNAKQSLTEMLEERRQKALIDHPEDEQNWERAVGFIPGWREIRRRVLGKAPEKRDAAFQQEMNSCEWYRYYIQACLQPNAISGSLSLNTLGLSLVVFGVDKPRHPGNNRYTVVARATGTTSLKRNQMHSFWLKENDTWQLPSGSTIQVLSGQMRYNNKFISRTLFSVGRQAVDFARSTQMANNAIVLNHATHCIFNTPPDAEEQRSPKREDLEFRRQLLEVLNNELIRYHHLIWTFMDNNQRYMMLDGFQVKAPGRTYWITKVINGQQQTVQETEPDTYRSIASVIENRLIGVVGNTIIMPVARGYNLDPKFRWDEDEVTLEDGTKVSKLKHHYMPSGGYKSTPYRISVPTKGVFGEAVMGACNSCEKKDDTRFWRWEESPIDEPTAIEPVSTGSRRSDPGDLTAKDFAQPIVNIQNAPAMPDPTGLGASMELLGKSNLFKDITGLEGNQKGVIDLTKINQEAAMHYADNAKELAVQAANTKNSDKIQEQINNSGLPQKEKDDLTKAHIEKQIGINQEKTSPEQEKAKADKQQALQQGVKAVAEKIKAAGKGKFSLNDEDGFEMQAEFEGGESASEEQSEEQEQLIQRVEAESGTFAAFEFIPPADEFIV